MVINDDKDRFQWKRTLYFICMSLDMPQSLLVFVVSFTPDTTNFIYIEFIELNKQKKNIVQVYTSIYTKADGSPC